jgi:hypothetical protein
VTDACAGDCSFLGDATYSTAEAYAASGGNVALMDCPKGCVAYPMGTNSRQRVSDAVGGTHGVVECDAAENWVAAMLAADLIDMFPNTSSNTAWAWWNPSGNEPDGNEHVYIAFKNFYPQNLSSGELAKTLYHEAYHHFHPTTGQADDLSGAAESFANMCYSTK